MKNLNNSLNWFEIPVTNFERARKFYSTIYDFDMPTVKMGNNQLGFFPVQPNHIGGAIVKGEGYIPNQNGSLIYLNGGENLDDVLNKVKDAGGKVILNKTLISPELGYYATFSDTEGNKVALHSMK